MKYLKVYESFQSDEDIHEICKKYGIKNYTINNGLVDVDGDVDLSYKRLTKLPLNFGKVAGYFYCSNNQLTSLEGGPSEVGKDFSCSYNKIVSLEGCPSKVGSYFYCSSNKLTSLEGCPSEVIGNFGCFNNQNIYDFIGIDYIGNNLECYNTILEEIWALFKDKSKIELINYIDPFRPPEIEGGKPICYLDKLNEFLKQIGKPIVKTLRNYECR